jgi:hypothetical protein
MILVYSDLGNTRNLNNNVIIIPVAGIALSYLGGVIWATSISSMEK